MSTWEWLYVLFLFAMNNAMWWRSENRARRGSYARALSDVEWEMALSGASGDIVALAPALRELRKRERQR